MATKSHETALRARRAELLDDLQQIEKTLDETPSPDWEDRASERQGDEVLEAHGHADQSELTRIDAALARIADGTYGACLRCGEDIAVGRLQAVPDAPLCAKCAAT